MGNPERPLGSGSMTLPEPEPVPAPLPRSYPEGTAGLLREPRQSAALNDAAERVGRAIGAAVERIRDLPGQVADARGRFTIIRGRKAEDAAATAAEWRQTARQTATQARNRAERLANENPLHIVAGAAGIMFVLGFVLRVWRSSDARD